MFSKILVPLDGSKLAERALEPAVQIARPVNGTIDLLRVPDVNPPLWFSISRDVYWTWSDILIAQGRQEAADYLEQVRQCLEQSGLNVRAAALEGDEAGMIVDYAAAHHLDLIVMSSHGYTGPKLWVLGSIAERVLQSAPCPVLLVRAAEAIQNVLITLDGSPLSELALQPGVAVARRLGAAVTLLYVAGPPAEGEAAEAGRDEAERYLRDIATAQPDCRTVVRQGDAVAATILAYAAEQDINLIAMSTHGRTGLGRWRYGSVAQKVLHGFHRSMLVVRPASGEPANG